MGKCFYEVSKRLCQMVDWEEINRTEDEDKLRKAKLWLFQENVRLQNERKELDDLNRRILQEKKRLKEENLFFDKKLEILQDGFRKLDEDRQTLERQRRELARERTSYAQNQIKSVSGTVMEETVRTLFRGTNNPLALRKRYRDLVKIFHPDNLFGDEELVQMINREYIRRKKEEA